MRGDIDVGRALAPSVIRRYAQSGKRDKESGTGRRVSDGFRMRDSSFRGVT